VRNNRAQQARVLAGVVVLAALLGLWGYQSALASRDAEIDALQFESQDLAQKLAKGKPLQSAYDALQAWTDSHERPLDALAELQQWLPPRDRLNLYSANFEKKPKGMYYALKGSWGARSREDAEALQDVLAAQGFSIETKPPTAARRDPDFPYEQDFVITKAATANASRGSAKSSDSPASTAAPPGRPATAPTSAPTTSPAVAPPGSTPTGSTTTGPANSSAADAAASPVAAPATGPAAEPTSTSTSTEPNPAATVAPGAPAAVNAGAPAAASPPSTSTAASSPTTPIGESTESPASPAAN
jgi:hypothetical protein